MSILGEDVVRRPRHDARLQPAHRGVVDDRSECVGREHVDVLVVDGIGLHRAHAVLAHHRGDPLRVQIADADLGAGLHQQPCGLGSDHPQSLHRHPAAGEVRSAPGALGARPHRLHRAERRGGGDVTGAPQCSGNVTT